MKNKEKQKIEQRPEEKLTPASKLVRMPKKNFVLITILAIITVLLVIFSIFAQTTPPKTTIKAVNPNAYIQTTLTLTTPQASLSAYQSEVKISSRENQILAVGLRISYDPKVLSVTDIKAGDFFTNPTVFFKEIDPLKGVISYDLVLMPGQTPAQSNGTVAILSFSPILKGTTTSINFLSNTKAMAQGHSKSALKTATGVSFAP